MIMAIKPYDLRPNPKPVKKPDSDIPDENISPDEY